MIETSSSQASRLTTYAVMSAAAAAGVASQGFAAVQTSAAGWSESVSVQGTVSQFGGTINSIGTAAGDWGAGGTLLSGRVDAAAQIANFFSGNVRNADFKGFQGGAFVAQFGQINASTTNAGFKRGKMLSSGAVIGAGIGWAGNVRLARSGTAGNGGNFGSVSAIGGDWNLGNAAAGAQTKRGFLAFRITDGASDWYYGYFDVEVSRDGSGSGSTLALTVHSWAFNNVAGQSITIGGAAAVPGGAGLAALAFGAAGLRGRRRSRN